MTYGIIQNASLLSQWLA